MDWPDIANVLRIKPSTDEKAQKRLWTVYRKPKKKSEKKKIETKNSKKEGNHKIDIYV